MEEERKQRSSLILYAGMSVRLSINLPTVCCSGTIKPLDQTQQPDWVVQRDNNLTSVCMYRVYEWCVCVRAGVKCSRGSSPQYVSLGCDCIEHKQENNMASCHALKTVSCKPQNKKKPAKLLCSAVHRDSCRPTLDGRSKYVMMSGKSLATGNERSVIMQTVVDDLNDQWMSLFRTVVWKN